MSIQKSLSREASIFVLRKLESTDFRGNWRLRQFVGEFLKSIKVPGVVRCSTGFGLEIVVDPKSDLGVEYSIFYTGSYEPGTLSVIKRVLAPGGRFVDVGANVGLMSLAAAVAVGASGRVDSFEPLHEIRSLLEQSIRINKLQNVKLHGHAVGSTPAVVELHRHLEVNRGSASLAWDSPGGNSVSVEVKTLDSVLADSMQVPIDMIKIDVEGWELEVLKGADYILRSDKPPVDCLEFSRLHPLHGGVPEDLVKYLMERDYLAYRLKLGKNRASPLVQVDLGNLPDHDNLFFVPKSKLSSIKSRIDIE